MMEVEVKQLEDVLERKFHAKILDQQITRLTAPGENYCSLILKLELTVERDGKKEEVHAVAKLLPLNKKFQSAMVNTVKCELQFYSKIIPVIQQFQIEEGVKETADFFPEFYGGRLSLDPKSEEADGDSIIILENLTYKGFVNEDRYIGFDLNTTKEILKKLATFHAVFIGLKLKKPDVFNAEVKNYFKEFSPPPPPSDNAPNISDIIVKNLEEKPECAKFLAKLKDLLDETLENRKREPVEPWCTVSHTDFWVNNILVKPTNAGRPAVIFLDFQMYRYKSYAADLVFFLLTSVQTHVQKDHFKDLIRYYYDEFIQNLESLHLNLTLSYDDYLEELKTESRLEIPHSIIFSTIIFGEKNPEYDYSTDENFDPFMHVVDMMSKMKQHQKDKMAVMVDLSSRMGWL